jgi:hypothetical protein
VPSVNARFNEAARDLGIAAIAFATGVVADNYEPRIAAGSDASQPRGTSPHIRLTPDPRPAADAETRLQGFVFLPVLDSRPDEQGNDKNGGQEDEDSEDNRRHDVHLKGVPA